MSGKSNSFKEKNPPEKSDSHCRCHLLWERLRSTRMSIRKASREYLLERSNNESPDSILRARREIESLGFEIEAIVLDGKRGVREVFSDIPVQMCQFHQKAIVRRYLTQNPRLQAAKELLAYIVHFLPTIEKEDFHLLLSQWYARWKDFLKEKTYDEDGKHWHYTHRRIRSAYRSLRENIDFLFTYQEYPELSIPNTTNSLDGSFGHMKTLLKNHRGVSKKRRFKMIEEILGR